MKIPTIKSIIKYFCLVFNYYRIPKGVYCYSLIKNNSDSFKHKIKLCPYWSKDTSKDEQECGYCKWLELGDWECECLSLLWDQCKECHFRLNFKEEK